jgi:triacylglycerol lipase
MPVVLVPGFRDDARILRALGRQLARQGLTPYPISPQPSNGRMQIERLAEQLAARIDALFGPGERVNLFGFSMGGLICRYYVQQLGGAERTGRLVTLASPHQGTWTAYACHRRPACVQMRPGSPFLDVLNRDLSALDAVDFVSLWTPFDLTIQPATSSHLPVGRVVRVLSPAHGLLLYDPLVLRIVATYLS